MSRVKPGDRVRVQWNADRSVHGIKNFDTYVGMEATVSFVDDSGLVRLSHAKDQHIESWFFAENQLEMINTPVVGEEISTQCEDAGMIYQG